MNAGRHETGDVSHIDLEVCANLVGNFPEALEIHDSRIGRSAGYDQLRTMFPRKPLDLVEIDQAVLAAHTVLYRVEPLSRQAWRRAVGQVSTCGKRQTHDGVARLAERQ